MAVRSTHFEFNGNNIKFDKSRDHKHWMLIYREEPENTKEGVSVSYALLINHSWDHATETWDRYQFVSECAELRDDIFLLTIAEYHGKRRAVEENATEDGAQVILHIWDQTHAIGTVREISLRNWLIQRWEAMLALDLFRPAVTI